jgi:hypothetical protein
MTSRRVEEQWHISTVFKLISRWRWIKFNACKIWGSHCRDYEEYPSAWMWRRVCGRNLPHFRITMRPSSGVVRTWQGFIWLKIRPLVRCQFRCYMLRVLISFKLTVTHVGLGLYFRFIMTSNSVCNESRLTSTAYVTFVGEKESLIQETLCSFGGWERVGLSWYIQSL